MDKSYLKIWAFLEGNLPAQEEEELMDWIDDSARNTVFFEQVVNDFSLVNKPSPAISRNYKWYWAAASILLFLTLAIWVSMQFESDASLQKFSLLDGSQIILSGNSKFEYDTLSFQSTKWIKIQGTAEIRTRDEEHLLVETQNGYLMVARNSTVQMQDLKSNNMRVHVDKGSIRWLKAGLAAEEIALMSGQNMLLKNDGKTILLGSRPESKKEFTLFNNYMNL
jgi:ferric-dicitrate binding protein FerR (iron transport regulator)